MLVVVVLTTLGSPLSTVDQLQADEPQRPRYRQRITIRFEEPDLAKDAVVRVEPLFDARHRAVTCRWDDNWTSDNLQTRDRMQQYGVRGTWYLNGRHFHPEKDHADDYLPVAKELLRGGNSVGGHSLTHPYVTYFHSNRMFSEMSDVRIEWESALDQPVFSYAFSFVDLRPPPEGKAVLNRCLKTLRRSGFYHLAEYTHFFDDVDLWHEFSPIMPPENNEFQVFKQAVGWAYTNPQFTLKSPCLSNSMHAWYGTSRSNFGYDELAKRLDLLSGLDNVWHCNQNEYAAYRRQSKSADLKTLAVTDNEIVLQLTRDRLLALDDPIPLTMSVSKIPATTKLAVQCETAAVSQSIRSSEDQHLFDVHHDRNQSLPHHIGHIANPANLFSVDPANADADFPDVTGCLYFEDQRLNLRLQTSDDSSLEDVRVQWRCPIGWKVAPAEETGLKQEAQRKFDLSQRLVPVGSELNRIGTAGFVAQVDFRKDGEPGRIHFTCRVPGPSVTAEFPKSGFAQLGPIQNDILNPKQFCDLVRNDVNATKWKMPSGETLSWQNNARDGYINEQWMNPEYVRTMGTWNHVSPTYVLRSRIESLGAQPATLTISHRELCTVILNQEVVEHDRVELRRGGNELFILYPGTRLSEATPRLAACFVRLSDPTSGNRLSSISYNTF